MNRVGPRRSSPGGSGMRYIATCSGTPPAEDRLVLELDHLFCMVAADDIWADRLRAAGWPLDEGSAHEGQGTRNRRMLLSEQFLELVWVDDRAAAEANPLGLGRRADWANTGASPFGFGFRGHLEEARRDDYWLYDGLGFPIWIHHTNETDPHRPLVFVLELTERDLETRRHHRNRAPARGPYRQLTAVRHAGPAPAAVPPFNGPPIKFTNGPHHVNMITGDSPPLAVNELLSLNA